MKAFFAVITVVFFLPLVVVGQTLTGIKAGATISQWQYKAENNFALNLDNASNLAFTFFQEIALYKSLTLQLEPTYSTRSFDMNIQRNVMQQLYGSQPLPTQLGEQISFTQKFASLECPILLKLRLKREGVIRPYVFAGPNVSFNLSATATAKFDTTAVNPPVTVTPNASTAILSVDTGLGIEVPLFLSICLVADARYTFGLSDFSTFNAFKQGVGTARVGDIRVFAGLGWDF
jgi:hypothetical protein